MSSKFGPYKVHPYADEFPLLPSDEFKELVDDIRRQGLQQPIILTHDKSTIVDGRNRYLACIEATTDPVFRTLGAHYTETMICMFIFSANIQRRQLTVGQRAIFAVKLEERLNAEARSQA